MTTKTLLGMKRAANQDEYDIILSCDTSLMDSELRHDFKMVQMRVRNGFKLYPHEIDWAHEVALAH